MNLLLDWAWKATALLATVWMAAMFLHRHTAALRHRIWAMALAGLVIAPVISFVIPTWHSRVLPALPLSISTIVLPGTVVTVTTDRRPMRHVPWAMVVWSAGFGLVMLRLLVGCAWIRWRSRPIGDEACQPLVARLAESFGITRNVRLLAIQQGSMPMTWGVFRPSIALPANYTDWNEERQRIVLAHELAHIGRGDWGWQICGEIAKAVYWFHPLVWLAARSMRRESEIACDDVVLNSGVQAAEYASELLKLSRMLKNSAWLNAPALAMARTSGLERTFKSMLNPLLNRRRLSARAQFITAAVILAVLIPLASLRAPAQGQSGKLTGTVYDPDRAIIVNATVVATNEQTNSPQTAITGSDGKYSFLGLLPGSYEIQVRQPGFARYSQTSVALRDAQDTALDVKLALGGVKESVEVVATRAGGSAIAPNAASAPRPARILVGGNVQATKVVTMVKPVYPEQARMAGVEGPVELQAIISVDGKLVALRVLKSLGFELDEAAMDAVRQWRYEPTMLNGRPVEVTTTITVMFKLSPG